MAAYSRGSMAVVSAPETARRGDLTGLVVAIGPDLTGRVHYAYRAPTDRRRWRRDYPGRRPVPAWDYVSLCGRRGLVRATSGQAADCASCGRILAGRRARLARRAGTDG
jgi:hypothetical protein